MAHVVTINRPEVVALIEEAAQRLTQGNKTEAVALAMRQLRDESARAGSLFGAHRGSVRVLMGAWTSSRRLSMPRLMPRLAARSSGDGMRRRRLAKMYWEPLKKYLA